MNQKSIPTIPIKTIINKLWTKKFLFLKVWIITFILSAIYIVPQPRIYTSSTLLAPEFGSNDELSGLANFATSLGISFGENQYIDAIYPTLYPDLISSNDFIVSLFDIQVKTIDGKIDTDLYTYLTKHQKSAFYKKYYYGIKRKIKKLLAKKASVGTSNTINPQHLSEEQFIIVEIMKSNIICKVDPLTSVISLKVNSQDPLIAANLTDSVCTRLQNFIINYRTSKAKKDVEYYEKLVESSYQEYIDAQKKYSDFYDSHKNISKQSTLSERDRLQTELSMALNTYQIMNTQAVNAKSKLQEKTPVFTMLQRASVPLRASAPKRVFFCIGMLMFTTIITTLKVLKNDLLTTIAFFSKQSDKVDNK